MTSLPDWLVERAALDEVSPAMRERVERADPRELADAIAAVRADNAAELAAHPAGPAVAVIEGRIATEVRQREQRRRQARVRWFGMLSTALAAAVVIVVVTGKRGTSDEAEQSVEPNVQPSVEHREVTRAKGLPRLLAFRQVGERAEQLEQDSLVQAGDLLQLRYKPVGKNYGLIASVDGAGVVTLHFPASEDAPAEATALAPKTTALPRSYELDAAPRFERFFFITGDQPIDVQQGLASLRELARRNDSDTAALELPARLSQWSLRLRKPDHASTNQQSTRHEDRHD